MPRFSTQQLVGRAGERIARAYLERRGYRVIAENFSCRVGELDLVCLDGRELVFVEVKTRTASRFGTPADAITPRKLGRMRRAAAVFLAEQRPRRPYRFEAVLVERTGAAYRLEHLDRL